MKATLTSKGQVTIPVAIREKLGLKAGQVLEFDESTPFLKAVIAFDPEEMRSVLGSAKNRMGMNSEHWLENTRGKVELPGKTE